MTTVGAGSGAGGTRLEFTARYLLESPYPLERTAEVIAGEQSCGTFVSLPGETEELRERARARVLNIVALEDSDQPALSSAHGERRGVTGPSIAARSRSRSPRTMSAPTCRPSWPPSRATCSNWAK